jgi:hypothetical protein
VNQTTDDRISILRESLDAGLAPVLDLSGAFQVDFEPGRRLYIYVETDDGAITARYETKEADIDLRRREMASIRGLLQNEIPVAKVFGFRQTQALKDRFVYTTRVEIDPEIFYHQTIVMGDAVPEAPVSGTVMTGKTTRETAGATAGAVPEALSENQPVPAAVAEAIREMESIDAKTLRQSLDMMNLKRSSVVRIALTRLFRSIGDAEELSEAVSLEAGKIVSPEDQEDLRMVSIVHSGGFLKPAIDLLYDAVFNK